MARNKLFGMADACGPTQGAGSVLIVATSGEASNNRQLGAYMDCGIIMCCGG